MIVRQNLHPHPPLRRLPPRHQLKLRNRLLRQQLQPINNHPRLFGLLSHLSHLFQQRRVEREICQFSNHATSGTSQPLERHFEIRGFFAADAARGDAGYDHRWLVEGGGPFFGEGWEDAHDFAGGGEA